MYKCTRVHEYKKEYKGTKAREYNTIIRKGNERTRVYEYTNTRIQEYKNTSVQGIQGIRDTRNTRTQGHDNTIIQEYKNTRGTMKL